MENRERKSLSFGKAFEFAIFHSLKEMTNASIANQILFQSVQKTYEKIDEKYKVVLSKAACTAIQHILQKEHLLKDPKILKDPKTKKTIQFNHDESGKIGDVRDILLNIEDKVLGISCKHNHQALKHSRLSSTIDFFKAWGIDSNGCSPEYWQKVKPLFARLAAFNKESGGKMLWQDIENKTTEYYLPVLNAWADELMRFCRLGTDQEERVCKSIISYLTGRYDFYKVIFEKKSRVVIQCFNFNGSLATRKTKYPDRLVSLNSEDGSQYSKTLTFNHGYSLNFRIHSASSKVEPSLKFDINAVGLPTAEIYQQTFDI